MFAYIETELDNTAMLGEIIYQIGHNSDIEIIMALFKYNDDYTKYTQTMPICMVWTNLVGLHTPYFNTMVPNITRHYRSYRRQEI